MLVGLFASIPLRHRFVAFVGGWQRLLQVAADPYRPERHYMRGPGPKWRAKQRRECSGSDMRIVPRRVLLRMSEPKEHSPI